MLKKNSIFVFHVHTFASKDSNLRADEIIAECEKNNISTIAICDHNEIHGATSLKKIAPLWLEVIVGEEIATLQGDIIGLFLEKRIKPKQDIVSTISQIKQQGGVVVVPHPLDRLRREAIGMEVLEKIKKDIDYIEIFNSRCVFSSDNHSSEQFAIRNDIAMLAGSDAHFRNEITNILIITNQPVNKKNLIKLTTTANFVQKKTSITNHLHSLMLKIKRKHVKINP